MLRRVALLASLSACGLFPDLGPLSGGDDAGGPDAMAADATKDVKLDVVTNDVAADAPPPIDASPDVNKSPCAQQHTFCDDFDKGTLGATWDNVDNGSGGTLSQTTNAVSPPYAFQAQVPSGPGQPYAMLQKYLAASAKIHFECDLTILGTQTANFEIDYFDFSFKPSGYVYGNFNLERLNVGGTSEQISKTTADAGDVYHDDNISEQLTSWKHLVVDIDFTKSTFTMTVDGATVDAMSMTPPLASAPGTLAVGVTYSSGTTTTWSVLTDNVVIDVQ
jgi:hypothetical protein